MRMKKRLRMGTERELLPVIVDGEPAACDEREGVGGHVALRAVGSEGNGGIGTVAIDFSVPIVGGHAAYHAQPGFFEGKHLNN